MNLTQPIDLQRYPVSQRFGENPAWYRAYRLPGHNGIDIAAPEGAPVCAAADGVVDQAANQPEGYGCFVRIDHGGFLTLYAHLSAALVQPGQAVKGGELIGRVGWSGNVRDASGRRSPAAAHLHFELRLPGSGAPGYGDCVDPLPALLQPHLPGLEPARMLLKVVHAPQGLNVRAGPGIAYAVVERLQNGTTVAALGIARQEVWVKLGPGRYAAMKYGEDTYLEPQP